MPKDNVYIYYSGATDVTAGRLMEALDIVGDKKKPKWAGTDIMIGWGCKTKDDVKVPNNVKVLNHPDKIRLNRNKFKAMQVMANAGSAVAPFISLGESKAKIDKFIATHGYPLVARRNYHQGGKHFWLVLTEADFAAAQNDGAQYIQKYIGIQDEYRIHVAFGNVLYCAKKVQTNDPQKSWKKQRIEKFEQKTGVKYSDLKADQKKVIDDMMDLLAKEQKIDRVVRSNKRGWKFVGAAANTVPKEVKESSLTALGAIGLDFGAVDVAHGLDKTAYILEVNSGPGLEGTALKKWTEAFKAEIAGLLKKPEAKPKAAKVVEVDEEVPVAFGAAEVMEGNLEAAVEKAVHKALAGIGGQLKAKGANHQKLIDFVQDLEEDGAEGMLALLSKLKNVDL